MNKFKKHFVCHSDPCLNPVVSPSYASISFKISKILSHFGFKVSFRSVDKMKFSSPIDLTPIENWSGTYIISYSSYNLGYINQTRQLKARLGEHRR